MEDDKKIQDEIERRRLQEYIFNLEEMQEKAEDLAIEHEQLKHTQDLLNAILSATTHGMCLIRGDDFVWCNNGMMNIFGWGHDELVGRTTEILFPDKKEHDRIIERINSDLSRRGIVTFDYDFIHKNGGSVACLVTGRPLDDKDISRGYIFSFTDFSERKRAEEALKKAHDELEERVEERTRELHKINKKLNLELEERKRAEEALRKSEGKYRALLETTDTGYLILDETGRVIDANQEYVRLTGHQTLDEILGRSVIDWTATHDQERNTQEVKKCMEQSFVRNLEIDYVDGNGVITPVEINAKVVDTEDGLRILALCRDITERRQSEKVLRESEDKYRILYRESKRAEEVYRSLIHSSADAIVIYDMEGITKYVSPAFTRIFGWTMEEVEGKYIPFLPESEKATTMEIINGLIENGTPCHGYETKRYTKDGQLFDVSISASRYSDHEGNPAGILVVIRDISEKKRLEAQFRQAQKMEAIGTLAGGIAHDFNNILMGIQGRTSLMLMDKDSFHPDFEHLKGIENYVKGAADLTKQLLGFARGGKYEVKPTDLNDLLKKSSEMFGRTKKEITIHRKFQEGVYTVEVDRGQIEQVLLNLYVNAWQAMPEGGDLYLETKNIILDEYYVKPYDIESGDYVKMSITDTGLGMDEATQSRIFDPFFTTKEMGRGSGLGLASVYGIVKNHKGYVNVYSEKDKGTTFNIYLPASKERVSEETEPYKDILKGTETVLLVDDEAMIIDVGEQILESLGYKVLVATSGEETIEVFMEKKERIDLIILDMVMPGMGGGEVYDKMKEINPNIKVLLSSGYSINGQATEILERGCDGFIQKPFNIEQLSKKIREILDKRAI